MNDVVKSFLEETLNLSLSGGPLEMWLIAIAVVVATFLLLKLLVSILGRKLSHVAEKTSNHIDDVITQIIKKTKWWLLGILSLFLGSLFVELPARVTDILGKMLVIALFLQLGIWVSTALKLSFQVYRQRQLEKNPASVTALNAINMFATGLLWLAVFLLAIDNLGYDVTALIAGLGVGGVAVALAVQSILGDLFASLSILIDKPFVVGDFLIVDDYMGSVEHVGLKTTRVRSLSGEQLVFSNSDLLKSRLRNYGRMYERRVAFNIGVTYDTGREQLKKIPGIMREAIERQDKTRFDRAHFFKYGDYSLVFEIVYYVLGPDYNLYMDIQQEINLEINEAFEREGIEFAFPTQTLLLQQQASTA
ncbi:MAG: mechanosensitive ion channel family protein [Candidatus Thiodiazotropha sp. 6PLUC2]